MIKETAIALTSPAAAVVILGSPVGILGGTIFGTVQYVVAKTLSQVRSSLPWILAVVKVSIFIVSLFASTATAWYLMGTLGYSMSLWEVVSLTVTIAGVKVVEQIALFVLGIVDHLNLSQVLGS